MVMIIFLKSFFGFLEPSMLIITGIISIVAIRHPSRDKAYRDRLTYAYHPIFMAAEPFLFKSIEKKHAIAFVEKYNEIESKYSLYIYPSLRYKMKLFSIILGCNYDHQSAIDEPWMEICKYIDKEYDRLCKITFMPVRSTAYRMNNNQFSSKIALLWGMFKLFTLPLFLFSIIWLSLLFFIGVTNFLL